MAIRSTLESQNTEQDEYLLIAKLDSTKNLVRVLQSIGFKESVTVYASENGLKFTVEDSKCLQASAFIQKELFETFTLKEDTVSFKIPLPILLDCLNIFGSANVPNTSTALKLCYEGLGHPVILYLEESGVLTDCHIKTHDADDVLDFEFTDEACKIIMLSDVLKDAWSDLDHSSEVLELTVSPKKPNFRLSTYGAYGEVNIEIDKDSDAVDSFKCTQTLSNKYKMSLMKPSLKALNVSSKVSIRTDERGILCMQFMIKTDDQRTCFVEYLCLPNEDID